MTPVLDVIGVTVTDMAAALAFYRLLGLDIPAEADAEPHVEVSLPGGMRLAFDAVDTIRSFDPDYQPPADGSRVSLAFRCADAAEVDHWYAELTGAGYPGHIRRGTRSGGSVTLSCTTPMASASIGLPRSDPPSFPKAR